ncbi:MAG: IS1595 family transposase [Parachlamydiaceae bacterium]|nr:IS1595 family transposase [Parachlamydiaceae bacterium]
MKQSLSAKLVGNVEVDEFTVGGRQKDHYGRKTGKKKATLIAVESLGGGKVGNIYIAPIDNFKSETLKYAIKSGVANSAKIKADEFQSYKTLSKEMNIERVPSHKGKNFKELHNQIMVFKNWLRGIHHKCSNTLYFAYCDEYRFRFNKRNNRKAIFGHLIEAMLHSNPHPSPILKTIRAYST